MKPKLIILNGPLGVGKSTIAERYAERHPLALNLDIDTVWSMIGHWREEKDASAPLAKKIAFEMARVSLQSGHDVIVPQIVQDITLAEKSENLASECNSGYYEILLFVNKEEAVSRFIQRGVESGNSSGFREGGIIATSGREDKLNEMYDKMMNVAERRLQTIRIESTQGNIDRTYDDLIHTVAG